MPFLKDIVYRYENILTGDGTGATKIPIDLNAKEIILNGIGEDGCDTFWFPMRQLPHKYTFCKTRRLPYDAPVSEMLIVLEHFLPDLSVTSGGFSDPETPRDKYSVDDEWIEAAGQVKTRYGIETKLFKWNTAVRLVNDRLEPLRRNLNRSKRTDSGTVPISLNEPTIRRPGFLPGL